MVLSNSPDVLFPPSDLWSDEPPLETERHLTIYYNTRERRSEDFRGPDFFVVLGTEYKERKSWVVWAEGGKYPNLILEILSESTAQVDRGLKKQLYQDVFRTPEYFWFDPFTLEFQGFRLKDAHVYRQSTVGCGVRNWNSFWVWSRADCAC
nr:Uma2 family endonuclease [Anthocerotibacter panamensis]